MVLDLMAEVLTAAGRTTRPSRRMLEVAVLGRASLAGDVSELGLTRAAYSIGVAYLTVTEQLAGEVEPAWAVDFAQLRSYLAGPGPAGHLDLDKLEQAFTASRTATAQAHARAAGVRVAREVEDLDLVRDRSELAEQLRLAAEDLDGRKVPRADKATAAGLRTLMRTKRTDVQNCRARGRLEDLRSIVAGPLGEAVALRARLDQEALNRQHEQRTAISQQQQDRTLERQHQAAARAQQRLQQAAARADLATTRSQAREVERLWNRQSTSSTERPWEVLAGLDLLRFHPDAQPQGTGVRALLEWGLSAGCGRGRWIVTGAPAVSFHGTRHGCPDLQAWGENTRAVLLPWLLELHTHEDALLRFAGGRSRVRPELYRPTPKRLSFTTGYWAPVRG